MIAVSLVPETDTPPDAVTYLSSDLSRAVDSPATEIPPEDAPPQALLLTDDCPDITTPPLEVSDKPKDVSACPPIGIPPFTE